MGEADLKTEDYQRHRVQFYNVFKRLFASKGRKMDESILAGYWHALGNYPIDVLSKAVDALMLEDSAFLPDAGKILSEIKAIRGYDVGRKQHAIPHYCELCNHTGMIIIDQIHDGRRYGTVFACRCPNGQGIKGFRPVPEGWIHPLEALDQMSPDHVWDEGVDVAKLCADCQKPYVVRHERRVMAGELQDTHLKTTKPPQCELCFREMGRRAGMWQ